MSWPGLLCRCRGTAPSVTPSARRLRGKHPSRRDYHLWLEPLEVRNLFALNVWMPNRLDPIGGIDQTNQALQLFQPATTSLEPTTGLTQGSITGSGTFVLTDTSSYTINLYESGTHKGSTTAFTASGTVAASLTEEGTASPAGFSVTSVVLTQTATLSWTYQPPGSSEDGTNTLTVQSLGTVVLDPLFWEGMDWYDPTQQLANTEGFNLNGFSTGSFNLTESGSDAYSFQAAEQETIGGSGGQPIADMLQAGQQTYSLTDAESFTYGNAGSDSFSLTEQGSPSGSSFSFGTVQYNESGSYSTSFDEQGTLTASGTGVGSVTENLNGSGSGGNGGSGSGSGGNGGSGSGGNGGYGSGSDGSIGGTQSQTYSFNDSETDDYSESASSSYTLSGSGSYAASSFSLGCVILNAQGSGQYSLSQSAQETITGTFSALDDDNSLQSYGVAGTLTNNETVTVSGPFSKLTSSSRSEDGQSSYSLTDQGSYSHASYTWANASVSDSASGTYTYNDNTSSTDSYSSTDAASGDATDSFSQSYGAGDANYGASADSGSSTESVTGQDSADDNDQGGGAFNQSFSQAGAAANGSYSLASYTLGVSQSGNFTEAGSSSSSEQGSGSSLETVLDSSSGISSEGGDSSGGDTGGAETLTSQFSFTEQQSSSGSDCRQFRPGQL